MALEDSLRHGMSLDGFRRCANRLESAPGRRLKGVELDGWTAHGGFAAFHDDRERDALLASAGWVVAHFSARTPEEGMVAAVTALRSRFGQLAGA